MAKENENSGAGAPPKVGTGVGPQADSQMQPPAGVGSVTGTSPETGKKNELGKDEVAVSKKTLADILQRMEDLSASNKTLLERDEKRGKEIDMLTNVADKAKLFKYQEQQAGPLITRARIAMWDGVPVLAWTDMIKNEAGYRNGVLVVDQRVRVYLNNLDKDGQPESKEIEYLFWSQNVQSEEGEVISKDQTKDGVYWTVQLKDGRKIKVDVRFINIS